MLDVEALSEMMAGIIAEEVGKAVAPLQAKIAELEARPAGAEMDDVKGVVEVMISDALVVKSPKSGVDGKDGTDGRDGKDGRGIADLLIDRDGCLIATMDDGKTKNLGPVIGKDGAPGNDGRDGFSLDDFDCQPVDERTIKMEFVRGETKHSYELQFPVVVYRGVFKDGEDYERGDMVTWGGSLWHCDTPTKDKPGTDSWTLAAKKGRDGKDAKVG